MKARVEEWSDQYDYHFSIYSTPSESLTDRFCRLDTEKFGKVPDITDKEYYTNSFHYDVRKNPTPFEKLDFEKVYPEAGASGGFIHYCEYPVLQQNPKPLKRFGIMPMTGSVISEPIRRLTVVTSVILKEISRRLSADLLVQTVVIAIRKRLMWSKRTCGYLGNPQARPMVNGRHKEIAARVKHMNGSTIKSAGHQVTD